MKKIAFFTPTIFAHGGESRVVTVIANELSKKYQVSIYTCEKGKSNKSVYGLDNSIEVNNYYPYSKEPLKSAIRYVYRKTKLAFFENHISLIAYAYYSKDAVEKMRKTIDGFYDIVIAVSGNLSVLLGRACEKKIQAVTIGWEHSSYEAYFDTPHIHMWKKEQIFIDAIKNLDSCIVLNEDIAFKYNNKLKIKCDVIYNPRSFFADRKSLLINKQFIACGRFVEAKGFDLLVESFKEFSKKDLEWALVLVGDGPLKEDIEKLIKKYNLEDRIFLTGYVEDIKKVLEESSIYLLSSRWEGFPMCVTEAYEIGLPVICFDIPAMIPLTKNKESIIVNRFDTVAFSEAMYILANSPALRKEMALNAKIMAESLSVENITQKWEDLFNSISWRKTH